MNKYEIDPLIKEKAKKLNEFILTSNKSASKHGVSDFTLIAYIKEHELIDYKPTPKVIFVMGGPGAGKGT